MTIHPSQLVDKLVFLPPRSAAGLVDKVRDRTILYVVELLRPKCLYSLSMTGLISSFGGQ